MTYLTQIIIRSLLLPVSTVVVLATPAPSATLFSDAECTVEPRTIAELQEIGTHITDTTHQVPVYDDEELPRGRPVGPDTREAVTQTLLQLTACLRSGEAMRMFALTTDNYILGQLRPGFDFSPWPSTPQDSTSQARSPLDDIALQTIHSMEVLADGQIAVIATFSGIDDPHPAPGRTYLMLFRNVDGQWLLDAQYDTMSDNTYVADLVGAGEHSTPTP